MKTIHKPENQIQELLDIFRDFKVDASTAIYYLYRLILLKYLLDTNATKSNCQTLTIPADISWNEWRRSGEEAFKLLDRYISDIIESNPVIGDIFYEFDFLVDLNNIQANNLLNQLILKLSDLDLSDPETVEKIDLALCQKLDEQSKKTGHCITPKSITNLVVKLLNPQVEMSVCDPFCGVGSFLVECAAHLPASSSNSISFNGQEIDRDLETISKIRLLLHGVDNFNIQLGDTIQEPQLLQDGKLKSFDLIMSVLPWGKSNFRQELITSDPYHRFRYGIPSKSATEFIYIQHILATLNSNGKAAVIVPHGVLFRGGSEGKIRANIIKADLLEAVIVLPANLFSHTGISTAILIFNLHKPQERQDIVLFIDASNSYAKNRSYYYLRNENIEKIARTYTSFLEEEGYAKIISLGELTENDYLLNINRYVYLPKRNINLHSEYAKLHKLETEKRQAEEKFEENLKSYLETIDQNEYFDAVSKISSRSPLQSPYGLFFSDRPMCGGDSGFIFQWFESFTEMKEHFINFELVKNCLLDKTKTEQEKIISDVRERFDTFLDNPRSGQLGIEKLDRALSEWFEIRWCGTFEQLLKEKGEFEIEVRKDYLTTYEDMMEKRTVKDRQIQENEVEDFERFLIDYGL